MLCDWHVSWVMRGWWKMLFKSRFAPGAIVISRPHSINSYKHSLQRVEKHTSVSHKQPIVRTLIRLSTLWNSAHLTGLFIPQPIVCVWPRLSMNIDQCKLVNYNKTFWDFFPPIGNLIVKFSGRNSVDDNVKSKCLLISEPNPKSPQLLHRSQ